MVKSARDLSPKRTKLPNAPPAVVDFINFIVLN